MSKLKNVKSIFARQRASASGGGTERMDFLGIFGKISLSLVVSPSMRNILVVALILVFLAALWYIIYIIGVKKAEVPGISPAVPTPLFQGPPPGAVPFVQGPTEPPPSR